MPFQPPWQPRKLKFYDWKKHLEIYHFIHLHHKWQSYDVWFLRYGVQQKQFFVILDHFLLFYLPMDPESQNFEKMKKIPEGIIILQTKMTVIWCMVPQIWSAMNRIFCHFGLLLPFYPLTTWKIKILKNEKNTWRYYHFTHVYHKWQSYDVWFLRYEAWRTEFFILDCFLPFYLQTTWKINILKNWKNTWRYHHFTQVYQKSWSYAILFLRYGA